MSEAMNRGKRRWLDVQRRKIVRKDANGNVISERELPHWYGRMKVDGKWKWFKLDTDKRSSVNKWQQMMTEHEQRRSGVLTAPMESAQKPLSFHVGEYLAALKLNVTASHYRIAKYMLANFINLAGWKTLAEINQPSAVRVVTALQAQGRVVSYTNQYLARVKAFIHWCIPERLMADPLAKMKRGNARKALKRRARRPLAEHELSKLLNTCPESRRLKYAIPAYTGLRRSELADVRWGDLHLDSVIPYLQLRPEQTKMGEAIALPLHPYIVDQLLNLTPGMPEAKLFRFLPEGRTMLRDLDKAGVKQADASGRRADYHGLRHTFAKRLDASGCSHATRRALLRHGAGDQTDGYTLAQLSEMYDAVKRLPAPADANVEAQVKTGTADVPVIADMPLQNGKAVVTLWSRDVPAPAMTGNDSTGSDEPRKMKILPENPSDFVHRQSSADTNLNRHDNRDNVVETGPRSSVG